MKDIIFNCVNIDINLIKINPRNTRLHSSAQINQIKNSIVEFGFTNPLLVDSDYFLIADAIFYL